MMTSCFRATPQAFVLAATVGWAAGVPVVAHAQSQEQGDFPADRFRPAMDAEGILDVESGDVGLDGDIDTSLWLAYAHDPLILYRRDDGNLERVASLVGHRFTSHLVGSVGLWGFVKLGADLPVVLYQSRDFAGAPNQLNERDVGALGIGDVRLQPKIALLRTSGRGINVALSAPVTLPTAYPKNSYLGDRSVTWTPTAAASVVVGPLRVAGNLGYHLRKQSEAMQLRVDDEMAFRVGAAASVEPFIGLPLEVKGTLSGSTAIARPFRDTTNSPLELLVGAAYGVGGTAQIFSGFGLGLVAGYGTPEVRFFCGFRFSPRARDDDADRIPNEIDACPDVAEDLDGFEDSDGCVDLDNDGDGVVDTEDGAPDEAEDQDGFEDGDGVPDPDNDKDGLLDPSDQCPNAAEDRDGYQDTDGCPDLDNDNDGILDSHDRCPMDAETQNGFEDDDGCPDEKKPEVKITKSRIVISEKVHFDTGQARIMQRSHGLLTQVAQILKQNTEIKLLRIEGHTDNRGSTQTNLRLSQARAEAVRRFLINAGVDPGILAAVGYGEARPIASNSSERGREANRRVEFTIVETSTGRVDDSSPVVAPESQETKEQSEVREKPKAEEEPEKQEEPKTQEQ